MGLLNQRAEAAGLYERAMELNPGEPEYAFQAAQWHERAGNTERAAELARRASMMGHEQAKKVLDDVTYCTGPYDAMEGADALVICTEWDAFRALDLNRAKGLLSSPVLVDLRNIYPRDAVEKAGFEYTAVGR